MILPKIWFYEINIRQAHWSKLALPDTLISILLPTFPQLSLHIRQWPHLNFIQLLRLCVYPSFRFTPILGDNPILQRCLQLRIIRSYRERLMPRLNRRQYHRSSMLTRTISIRNFPLAAQIRTTINHNFIRFCLYYAQFPLLNTHCLPRGLFVRPYCRTVVSWRTPFPIFLECSWKRIDLHGLNFIGYLVCCCHTGEGNFGSGFAGCVLLEASEGILSYFPSHIEQCLFRCKILEQSRREFGGICSGW